MTPQLRVMVGLIIALVVSLCANAFMGGVLLSRGAHHPPSGMMAGTAPEGRGALRDFAAALPPDMRAPLMQGMRDQRQIISDRMRHVQEARQASMMALRAEPFDSEALRSALAAQRTAQSDVQAVVHEGILKSVAQMTPDQRQQLSQNGGRLFK